MQNAYNHMQNAYDMKRLLTPIQFSLLTLFFTNPKQTFYIQQIARILGKKAGVFQRTLNNLVEEGLLTNFYEGRARYFQANTAHPLYIELKKIISKTTGVEGSLKELVGKIKEIEFAILYGSFAKAKERKDSDVDLLVVASLQAENKLLRKIKPLERRIQREIHYKLYSREEYRKKRLKKDPFLEEVLNDQYILLKGNPDVF